MRKRVLHLILPLFLVAHSCSDPSAVNDNVKIEAQTFLDEYTTAYLDLQYQSAEAEWASNTRIVDGDTMNAYNTQTANGALAAFTGGTEIIETTRKLLENKAELDPVQVEQLEAILYQAANNPATVPELVAERIKAEALQTEALFGFDFQIDGESVSTNDIDNVLKSENDVGTRLKAWEASKAVGQNLKDGLEDLQKLRNETVQALGYSDYFTYQVSDYGMSVDEMAELCNQLMRDVWPLYRELHTYARHSLSERYGEEVPEMLPAHWLPNRWGQDWSALVEVEGIDLDAVLEEKGSEWLVKQAEEFYISLGFDALPETFYTKSSLYPLSPDFDYKKNNHASAWHMDLQNDVRSLMSVIPNAEWYETTHHELGHIYYYMSYTNPDVPPLLRGGANRAFHEAIGSMLGLAAMQKPFLEGLELIPAGVETDETQALLKEALNYIVFIPWSAGVMTFFEQDLYTANLPKDQFNELWWELKQKYQGISPPSARGEEFCDASSKTHINNDAAQYYDYALSNALLFQVHNHIATTILKQDPRATNYYGSQEVGQFLESILKTGSKGDWRELIEGATGEPISAKAMLSYFEPLTAYLQEINAGREHTLPENFD